MVANYFPASIIFLWSSELLWDSRRCRILFDSDWALAWQSGSAHGLLWQPREAEGRVWGILREVAEKEMGSWDSRDYHKHHLSVVLVTNTYCPFLSNCCGDSLDIEMKRSLPEMKKKCFSISMRLTQLLMIWPKKRPNGNIWKGMKILGRQLLNNYVFLSGKNSMVRTVQPWNLNALDKDIARLGNQHCSLFF